MTMIVLGSLAQSLSRFALGARGDMVDFSSDSVVGLVGGSVVFAFQRGAVSVDYRRGRMVDRFVMRSGEVVWVLRMWPSERWGPFGSRLLAERSSSQTGSGSKPARRSEVLDSLRTLGWIS
jgi:hypothetical protein